MGRGGRGKGKKVARGAVDNSRQAWVNEKVVGGQEVIT